MSSQDHFRRPSPILKKSLAEVIGTQRPPETIRIRVDPLPEIVPLPDKAEIESRNILASIGEVTYSWDLASDRLKWGENISNILPHIAMHSLETGMGFAELLRSDNRTSRYWAVKNSPSHDTGKGVAYQIYYALTDAQGKAMWIEDTGRWFADAAGAAALAHGVIRIVTHSHELHLASNHAAKFDPLTGTYNRNYITRHLEASLETALRDQKSVVVLLANIENLGIINRAYGYDVADEVIVGLANRLRATMRDSDRLARYAGNKFAFILENCDQDQMAVAARRFLASAGQEAFETSAGPIHGSMRMGGAVAPRHGRSAKVLLRHAEEALELSRTNVAQPFVAYTESLVRKEARLNAAQTTRDITTAIAEQRVQMAFQPVIEARTRQVAFHEALIRISRKDGSLIEPNSFLPTAERIGLIKILDQYSLDLTLAHIYQNPTHRLAFNVSSATVHDPDWLLRLQQALAPHPELGRNLIVEITETFAADNLESTQRVIEDMQSMGICVAMDDFGSGHTSFRSLRHLKFDMIKIDGAFIKNLSTSADDRVFTRSLIDLARHIGVPVVAEWVEDGETAHLLTEWGVDYLQGYYFGKPTSV